MNHWQNSHYNTKEGIGISIRGSGVKLPDRINVILKHKQNNMETLQKIFNEIGHFGNDIGCNDKGGTHSYIETYEKLFLPFQKKCTLLEIGIAQGDSIKLFDRYFENSHIIGCDLSIIFTPPVYKNKVSLIAHDATKPSFLNELGDAKLDIVIDDGSHMEQDQVDTFNLLKGHMNKGGIYIIEDILALDQNSHRFKAIHDNCEIIDLRKVKNRFDDVLIVYRF